MSCAEKQVAELIRVATVGQALVGADQEGGFFDIQYDLTQAGPLSVAVGKAYGLYVPVVGNPSGARVIADWRGGGRLTLAPGHHVTLPFDALTLQRASDSVATGTLTIRAFRTPRADFRAFGGPEVGAGGVVAGHASVLTQTQTYNSAAGNQPSGASAGISIAGAKAVRPLLDAGAGRTWNTGVGTAILWYYSATAAAWMEGRTQLALPSNSLRYIAFDAMEVGVGWGRLALEVRSATHSAGAGDFTSYLEVL